MSLEVLPYVPERKADFYKINQEWISSMFVMEDIDEQVLSDPETHILTPGGYIWFVADKELGVVGTCALRKTGEGQFELTKMGVLEKARGLRAGGFLLQHIVKFVKSNKSIECCYLLTNVRCEAAIHLYEKHGFVHDPQILQKFGGSYQRCDVAMRLKAFTS